MRKIIFIVLGGLVTSSLTGAVWWYKSAPPKNLEVYFLDVGQGDAALIKTPAGHVILIDGGPDNSVLTALSQHLPFLKRDIDAIILTHPDADHLAGLLAVMRHYQIRHVYQTAVASNEPLYQEWVSAVHSSGSVVAIVDRAFTVELGDGVTLEVIHPRARDIALSVDTNDTSIVARLKGKQHTFLFMGDASVEVEEKLIAANTALRADVLKVSHHGSPTATSEQFLQAVRPQYAIISVGENNFGHPSLRVLQRLQRHHIEVVRTDQRGTITAVDSGPTLELSTAKEGY